MPPNSVRLVTDTTACLPAGFAEAHGIEVVPQIVRFGEEAFLEGIEITYADYMRRLRAPGAQFGTAAAPPAEFIKAYRRQLAIGSTVLSLHPSSDVSGTIRSANIAKSEGFAEADIRIIDSRSVAGCLGAMVQHAVAWIEAGLSADETIGRLEALFPRGRMYFLVPTLEYLQRGGRIGGAAALLGSVLQIKPLLELRNGRVELLERVRTYPRALERLKELAAANCPHSAESELCVMHADNPGEAEQLAGDLRARLGISTIPIFAVGAAITTHAGPGTIGVGFFTASRP
jgi:fatty acid kinase fatty acid binding subunit